MHAVPASRAEVFRDRSMPPGEALRCRVRGAGWRVAGVLRRRVRGVGCVVWGVGCSVRGGGCLVY
jgi:hypothetical protein